MIDQATIGQEIQDAARKYLGVRWRHQGRDRGGLDCGGLVILAGKDAGVLPKEFELLGYRQWPTLHSLQAAVLSAGCRIIPVVQRRPGDIAMFYELAGGRLPCHLGVISELNGAEGLIHSWALSPVKRVAEITFDTQFHNTLSCVMRFPVVDD